MVTNIGIWEMLQRLSGSGVRAGPDAPVAASAWYTSAQADIRYSTLPVSHLWITLGLWSSSVMDYLNVGLDAVQSRLAWVATDPYDWKLFLQVSSWAVCLFESYLLYVFPYLLDIPQDGGMAEVLQYAITLTRELLSGA